jgi:hypothetical protein
MENFIVYDTDTGQIIRTGTCELAAVPFQIMFDPPNYNVIIGQALPDFDYINTEQVVTPRPNIVNLSETSEDVWFSNNNPVGASLEIWDNELNSVITEVYESSGEFEISLPDPGAYKLISKAPFPYINITQIIEVE